MRGDLGGNGLISLLARRWRLLVAICIAGAGGYVATEISDRQGRADIPLGYAVRMTCEDDPEAYLWSGGCDRIAADLGRTDKPTFTELYRAFVVVHHTPIPAPATLRRFAAAPCENGFNVDNLLKGTRFVLSPDAFADVCSRAHATAIMNEIDARDRALLTIEREGLTYAALAAGALANLARAAGRAVGDGGLRGLVDVVRGAEAAFRARRGPGRGIHATLAHRGFGKARPAVAFGRLNRIEVVS